MNSVDGPACTEPHGSGRFLEDAKTGALLAPGRERDRSLFFDVHLRICTACHQRMIDYANGLALQDCAASLGISVHQVEERIASSANQLKRKADKQGVPLEELVKELLTKDKMDAPSGSS